MSGSSNFKNVANVTLDEVQELVRECTKFQLSVCVDKTSPSNHTAIMLRFNDKPKLTVNVRLHDGTNKITAIVGKPKAKITIEPVTEPSNYDEHVVTEPMYVFDARDELVVFDCIKSIVSSGPEFYNLFVSNCRDHVLGALKNTFSCIPPDIEKKIDHLRVNDIAKGVGGILFIFVVVFTICRLCILLVRSGRSSSYLDLDRPFPPNCYS